MEILKQLLSQTFHNRLLRLEKRSTQHLKDLKFTGVSFIKQGQQLKKLALITIEDRTLAKRIKANGDIKRDISADIMLNRNNARNIHKGVKDNKPRSNTPDFIQLRERVRNKTPSNNIDAIKSRHNKTKTEYTTTLTNVNKRTAHNKMLSTIGTNRNKTPDKIPPVIIKKKEKEKDIKANSNDIHLNTSTNQGLNSSINMINHKRSNNNMTSIQINKERDKENEAKNVMDSPVNINQAGNIERPELLRPESPIIPIKTMQEINKLNIEKAIKDNYNQPSIVSIIQYLSQKDQLNLFTSMKCFKGHLTSLIIDLKIKFETKHKLTSKSSLTSLINELKQKYQSDQLNYSILPFQITRGAAKAVELLNEELYNRIYHQTKLLPPLDQIIIVYRIFFQLLNIKEICSIETDEDFWLKASGYILNNNKGQTGTFFSQSGSLFDFSSQNIIKIINMISGKEDNIKPTFYSKICGTTGLVVFLIKDALEYCGVFYYEKKTIPAILYHRLLYMKSMEERLSLYITFLKAIND